MVSARARTRLRLRLRLWVWVWLGLRPRPRLEVRLEVRLWLTERTRSGAMRVPEHVAGKPLRQTEQSVRSIHRPTEPVAAASALSTESPRTMAEAPNGVARAVAAPARTERRPWRWRLEAVGFEGEAARRQVYRANPDMGGDVNETAAATTCEHWRKREEPRFLSTTA